MGCKYLTKKTEESNLFRNAINRDDSNGKIF